MSGKQTGYVASGSAQIYYETAGTGQDFLMIHAGVADHRQWQTSFDHFSQRYRTTCYDLRGFGRSEPVAGDYLDINDLEAVYRELNIKAPAILMGCSMGGSLAMDFTLSYPERVAALIMVCSGPSGLQLDVPEPEKFAQVIAADEAGDIDLVCELETQIWFDGEGRGPEDVDAEQRALLYEMNRLALVHDDKGLGQRGKNISPAGYKRLAEISVPVLVITGARDIPYMDAAADYMCERLRSVERKEIVEAAHLPNMEQPDEFNQLVGSFLEGLPT